MVACVDDAILDLLDRNIVGKGVERPIFFLRGKKGFELGDLSLLEVELDSIATFQLGLVSVSSLLFFCAQLGSRDFPVLRDDTPSQERIRRLRR